MPFAAVNGVDLFHEESGSGFPIVFSHEFAGDSRSWAPQVRFFARRYRTVVYNARGYAPSTVPLDPSAYSEEASVADLHALIRHLGIERAHIVGLSMGANVTLKLGLAHPEVCASLVVAGAGYGSADPAGFRRDSVATAELFEQDPVAAAETYGHGPARLRFEEKDPAGFAEMVDILKAHSGTGSALTMRGVQARRQTVFEIAEQLGSLEVPTLVMAGDEDELALEPALLMKRSIPGAGLAILPNSGHVINLEEPALFNQLVLDFLAAVDQGRWDRRRDR